MATFSDEDLIDLFSKQLPDLLERRPELEPLIYNGFLKAFVRREEVAGILEELRALRDEVNQRFEQVDQRFEQTDDKYESAVRTGRSTVRTGGSKDRRISQCGGAAF